MKGRGERASERERERVDSLKNFFAPLLPPTFSVLGWGITCQQDQYNRPILGQLNLSPSILSQSSDYSFWVIGISRKNIQESSNFIISFLTATKVHEITHVLGFSNYMFDQFVNASGDPIPSNQLTVTNTRTFNSDSVQVTSIITPTVLNQMSSYFNCSNPGLADLEEYGPAG